MDDNWLFLISGLCGFLLLLVTIALIFSKKFRKDLLATENEATILGFVTLKGVVVVVLSGMFLFGLIYPIYHIKKFDCTGCENKLKDCSGGLQSCNVSLDSKLDKNDLTEYIQNLSREDQLSVEIRKVQKDGQGPWSPSENSKLVQASVPGQIPEGEAIGCPEYYNKELQLIASEYTGNVVSGIKVKSRIVTSNDCKEIIGHDLQISCIDANELLSGDIVNCDTGLRPNSLWTRGISQRIFPMRAVVVRDLD